MDVDRKKVAAPGRRGSTRGKFSGNALVDGIDYSLQDKKKADDDEEVGDDSLKEVATAEGSQLEIESLRLQSLQVEAEAEEAERVRNEIVEQERIRRQDESAKVEKERKIQIEQENARKALEATRIEEERLVRERIEQERVEQERVQQTAEADARATRERIEQERARRQAEIDAEERAEEIRIEQERARRKAAAEAKAEDDRLALQRAEQEEREENERIERERARRQAEKQEKEQARMQAEAEQRAKEEAEEEELQQKIAAEKARRESLRQEEEARARAEAEAEAAEELRIRQQRLREAQAAASATAAAEDAVTAEKRRKAEEQRRKRAMFLDDMDSFSENFEAKALQQQQERESSKLREEQLMQQKIAATGQNFQAPKYSQQSVDEEEEKPESLFVPPRAPVHSPVAAAVQSQQTDEKFIKLSSKSGSTGTQFDSLASSLFATGASPGGAAPPPYSSSGLFGDEDSDQLRVPTRIGTAKEPKKAVAAASTAAAATVEKTALPVSRPPPAPIPAGAHGSAPPMSNPVAFTDPFTSSSKKASKSPAFSGVIYDDGDEDEDEEGRTDNLDSLSAFLTLEERRGMSAQQKAVWRAAQADLTTRRKDFHGAVTYAFDGIFSWQMYGSAEAVDETGKAYTEYLMRCQWGTTFENLQPWISARRYREFDLLDIQLRKQFPTLSKTIPALPEKDYFRFLEADVVQRRRAALEEYFAKIISSLPSILRSEQVNEFLNITERVASIRAKLTAEGRVAALQGGLSVGPDSQGEPLPGPTVTSFASAGGMSQDGEFDVQILSLDQAEEVREATGAAALDEDELGQLEEDIRDFVNMMRTASPLDTASTTGPVRALLCACTMRWPRLRATAVVGAGVDFTLIPRAMQSEEDLIRAIDDYRSLRMAHTLT